jgi:hypothetical protein
MRAKKGMMTMTGFDDGDKIIPLAYVVSAHFSWFSLTMGTLEIILHIDYRSPLVD